MATIKEKRVAGHSVKEERIFTNGGKVDWGALYEAEDWLKERFFVVGRMDHPNPIGFWNFEQHNIPAEKWHNLTKEDKRKLSGVILSDNFRNGDVKIVLFKD